MGKIVCLSALLLPHGKLRSIAEHRLAELAARRGLSGRTQRKTYIGICSTNLRHDQARATITPR